MAAHHDLLRGTASAGRQSCSASLLVILLLFSVFGCNEARRTLGMQSSIVVEEKLEAVTADDGRGSEEIESDIGVVAADDGRCSEIGVQSLREGGHAVDAVVATALCLGVVHPMSSGIGGGAFIVVRDVAAEAAEAIDCRETAPAAASKNMYEKNPSFKSRGALSMGVPGEIAGLYAAWSKYGRLSWKALIQPSIKLARDGFVVKPLLEKYMRDVESLIMADPGLREVFAPNGKLLNATDICYNPALSRTLEAISIEGPQAFYNGSIGEKFIKEVRTAGGIVTMEDMRGYKVEIKQAIEADVMGYKILGMPPPSSGTLGMALVLNILGSYKEADATRGLLGLHRLIEAIKHMLAMRMNLGDPDFVNISNYVTDMLSLKVAEELKKKILDNTTFEPDYYLAGWSQLRDHGTSHLCIVDADRNAVSMTTTVNSYFGAGMLSPSTGIVLNNEMDDFSTPTEISPDRLPPAPANFIEPRKRPLSSMTPVIILKGSLTLNVDAFFYCYPAALGCIIRDYLGNIIAVAGYLSVRYSPLHAEFLAILKGLELIRKFDFQNVTIETDCLNAVALLSEDLSNPPWRYQSDIRRYKSQMELHPSISIKFIRREANKVAHLIAQDCWRREMEFETCNFFGYLNKEIESIIRTESLL